MSGPMHGMSDDGLRRQLRFSLFLQAFAGAMLTVALVVRVTAFGWDVLASVLALGVVVIATAFGLTLRYLRR